MPKLWLVAVGLVTLILVAAVAVELVDRVVQRSADTPGNAAGAPGSASPSSHSAGVGEQSSATPAPSRRPSPKSAGKASATSAKSAKRRVPTHGPKAYTGAHLWRPPKGKRGALVTYNVRVQKGLPYDADATAKFIQGVLNDKRSWGRSGDWRIKLVPTSAKADVHIYLVTRTTTDRLCAPLKTGGKVSCFNKHRVVLNADRWAYGAKSYGKDLIGYRRNLVNHEFGHSLGHGHVTCPGKGKLAPIMMQQTKGLHGCKANPWPYPKA